MFFVLFDDGRSMFSQELPENAELVTIRVPVNKRPWDLIPQYWIFAREFRALLHPYSVTRIKSCVIYLENYLFFL